MFSRRGDPLLSLELFWFTFSLEGDSVLSTKLWFTLTASLSVAINSGSSACL